MDYPTNAAPPAGPPTLPETISLAMRGFQDQDEGRRLAAVLVDCLQEISRVVDLASLEGLTLAHDYLEALHDLDRGYEVENLPRPSDAESVGIGMVLPVVRDGETKSHIIMRPDAVAGLLQDPRHDDFRHALYSLAHECAHVETTACFERAFPEYTRRSRYDHPHDAQRWDIILPCWNEFAACWISAQFAGDLTATLEEVFLQHLATAKDAANHRIQLFRVHKDMSRVLADVYAVYGALMKYSAFHLGNILGQKKTAADFPKTLAALEGHWFRDAFRDLDLLLRQIASEFGRWPDKRGFEQIADIADSIIEANALDVMESLTKWDIGDTTN